MQKDLKSSILEHTKGKSFEKFLEAGFPIDFGAEIEKLEGVITKKVWFVDT